MRIEYELGEPDLLLMLRVQGARRQARWSRHPLVLVAATGVAAAIAWPLWRWLTASREVFLGQASAVVFGFAVAVAAVVVFAIRNRVPVPRYPGIRDWAARQALRRSLSRSVLGPVTVALGEGGLVRTNSAGPLTVPAGAVEALVASEGALFVVLERGRRVVVLPARALADAEAARARLEAWSGKVAEVVAL